MDIENAEIKKQGIQRKSNYISFIESQENTEGQKYPRARLLRSSHKGSLPKISIKKIE